jgi:hypothetical protein
VIDDFGSDPRFLIFVVVVVVVSCCLVLFGVAMTSFINAIATGM